MATKKVTSTKRVSKKKVTKKRTTTARSKKTATKKAARKRTQSKTKKTTAIQKRSGLSLSKERVQLAALSPFRYPLNYNALAAQTSRYAGIFLVLIGAIFTAYNLQFLTPFQVNSAVQRATVTSATEVQPEESTEPEEPAHENTEHDIHFNINKENPLRGHALLTLRTEHAENVTFIVFNVVTQEYTTLGQAERFDDKKWRHDWNTKDLPDGKYKLKAVVQNDAGSHNWKHDKFLFIKNTNDETGVNEEGDESVIDIEDNINFIDLTEADDEIIDELIELTDAMANLPNEPVALEADTETTPETQETEPLELSTVTTNIKEGNIFSGTTGFSLTAPNTTFIELYAVQQSSLTEKYLGLARKTGLESWRFNFNSRNIPNGVYKIVAKAKTTHGFVRSTPVQIVVENELILEKTDAEEEIVSEMKDMHQEVSDALLAEGIPDIPKPRSTTTTPKPQHKVVNADIPQATSTESVSDEVSEDDVVEIVEVAEEPHIANIRVNEALGKSQKQLTRLHTALAHALRNQDPQAIEVAQTNIQKFKDIVRSSTVDSDDAHDTIQKIDEEIELTFTKLAKRTERNEKIIKERVGEKVFLDSDSDGLSDYDEVNLYDTDPFSADSDGDGFNDDAEIAAGFNPKDSEPEALIAYESPKELGIVREDILEVTTVANVDRDVDDLNETNVPTLAVIAGKGLPNSFVTLYIFSTPIVVTVKTDDDGSWNYTFDKELEDGAHEVFVGITDNAGKIVAKSKPFEFVKTAQAFTPVDAAEKAAEAAVAPIPLAVEQSFLSQHIILLVLSLTIIALGLALMLIGLHMKPELNQTPAHA